MKNNYQYTLTKSDESEEQNSYNESRNENGKRSEIKSRSIHNWNDMRNRRAWFVVDRRNNKIVNGPFETRKIATLYIEEHESLCRQCVMNGSEISKKYQIYVGVPRNGRSD